MFRKIAILAGLFLALASQVPLAHTNLDDDNPMRPDIVGWGSDVSTAPIIGIDNDGDFLPGRNARYDVGSPTKTFRVIHAQSFSASSGMAVITDFHIDLTSASHRGITPSGVVIPTTTLAGSLALGPTTYYANDITQSSGTAARNLVCFPSHSILVATTTLVMSATFYGYNGKGESVSENIILSTRTGVTQGTWTVVNATQTMLCIGIGNVPFIYITSFTVQITSMTDSIGLSVEAPVMYIGWGNKIGLSNNIDSRASDVLKITAAGGRDMTNQTLFPLVYVDTDQDYFVPNPLPGGADEHSITYITRKKF